MPRVFDNTGSEINCGALLGQGGEGTVYDVSGKPNFAIKIYRNGLDKERAAKIGAMVRFATPNLTKMTAWPAALVLNETRHPIGLLMPKVVGKELHLLYGPKSRLELFPAADFRYLLAAATNLATAFAAVHDSGCVIGDVNERGILVSTVDATVRLIDCDSFQFKEGIETYSCNVGVAHYTPPELQGHTLRGRLRTINHDNFGLAVLIFRMLFLSRHPFVGNYMRGEFDLSEAISQHRFAYGANRSQYYTEPPPHVPSLAMVGSEVSSLFERAFSSVASAMGRPSAVDWVNALADMARSLKQCDRNRSHWHHSSSQTCPWCSIESALGMSLFAASTQQLNTNLDLNRIDFAEIRRAVASIVWPTWPDPKTPRAFAPQPTSAALSVSALRATERKQRPWKYAGLIIGVAIALAAAPNAWFIWLAVAFAAHMLIDKTQGAEKLRALGQLLNRERRLYGSSLDEYSKARGSSGRRDPIELKRSELNKAMSIVAELPKREQEIMSAVERRRREQQMQKHLERFFVTRANIHGITRALKDALTSYNIETAADVTHAAVRAVPGFGEVRTRRMVDWRKEHERSFVFNSGHPIDPRELQRAKQDIDALKRVAHTEVAARLKEARSLIAQRQLEMQAALIKVEAAAARVAQAEVDLAAAQKRT